VISSSSSSGTAGTAASRTNSSSSSSSSSSSGYKLEALVHQGPRSVVWKATRLDDGSIVAIKVRSSHICC
jgi:hypothetical protein